MGSDRDHGSPTRAQQRMAIRRRRTLAGAAVLACVVADVWSVSWAGAREPAPTPPPAATSTPSVSASGPVAATDPGTDSQVSQGQEQEQVTPTPSSTNGSGGAQAPVVVESGSGTFSVVAVPASSQKGVVTTGRQVRYTVEIEGGIGVPAAAVAAKVSSVLLDPRGWQTQDHVRFVNVSPAQAAAGAAVDLRITLASPTTTDRLCAPLQTNGEVSCHNGGRVVLNARRWLLGATAYGSNLDGYRTYLVNHEVGHGIGHDHVDCAGPGKPAPVMMQQTYGLKGCTAWPWPTAAPKTT